MTLFEAGVIAGTAVGATTGGAMCRAHGAAEVLAGAAVGLIAGGVTGWLYVWAVMFITATIGIFFPRPDQDDIYYARLTRAAIPGVFAGIVAGAAVWRGSGWLYALLVMLLIACITAVIAIARCHGQQRHDEASP